MKRPKTSLYPIRAAARLTGLSIDTLRAWEKRYAVVQPERRNGIRVYRESDIERLSVLRRALDQGHSIVQASKLSNSKLTTEVWAGVNPPTLELRTKDVVIFDSFQALERNLQRVGGRF